jgi:DNA-binding beta-propeller fold protein YncE
LALGPDRLWVIGGRGSGARLAAFRLADGRPLDEPPEAPTGVAAVDADAQSTWVLNDEGAHRLAVAGAGLVQEVNGTPVALDVDGNSVWVLDAVGDDLVVASFDADGSPEVLEKTVGPARKAGRGWRGALSVDGGEAWVTDGHGTLDRFTPNGTELQPIDAAAGIDVTDVALDGRWAWAATDDGRLLRFDRATLDMTEVEVSRRAIVEVVAARGVAWTADEEGDVRRVPADAPEPRAALPLDHGRKVLVAADDGSAVYVANADTGQLDRLDPASGRTDPARRIDLTAGFG